MSWRQRQKELDQLNRRLFRWFSLIAGTFMGAFLGWLIVLKTGHEEVLFRFEIELTVAAVCGLAAYRLGERFIDLLENILEHADAGSGIDINID